MDELEFRRAILADPHTQADDVNAAIEEDSSKKQYVDDVRNLNAKIQTAANVDVPEGLASKLLLRQALQDDSTNGEVTQVTGNQREAANDRSYWQIATAACVAFFIGLIINVNALLPGSEMDAGEYALNYTHKDMANLSRVNNQVPLNQVNAQLASYGVQMEEDIGQVYNIDSYHCNYNDVEVLRLVVGGEAGNISVYIFPKENRLGGWDEFNDDRFTGKATRYSQADIVIVGEKAEPLNAFQSKVENSMKWRI